MGRHDEERLLLEGRLEQTEDSLYTGDGSVDLKGRRVLKSNTGTWRACPFILGNECCERLAYYGISTNLVSYLTKKLHQGNVSAARNVTTWQGTCYLTPLIGAVLADAYFGRYWTIAAFSTIYFIGMCTLTISASVPSLKPIECVGFNNDNCPSATPGQYAFFFTGLYLIALGTGGIKPCVSSFGADQFDDTDTKERVSKGSFFNWFYFSINIGALISSSLIVWIQDNKGWGLGFGIPALFMGMAIISFFLGTPLYRFQNPGGSPITRMCQVLVASFRNWNLPLPVDTSLLYETPDKLSAIKGSRKLIHTDELTFLDKAAVPSPTEDISDDPWRLCTVTQVEELKILIRMFPIWATGIVFSAVYAQMSTMFVEQGMMMDTTIGSFTIPAASLSTFDVISVILWVPVYDRILVPIARKFTNQERGFTELQRMGIGLFLSVLCMSAAALVEVKRLDMAASLGLIDQNTPVPINILWQIPQYFLLGAAEVFTFIGQLEFFYDQSPDAMRSLCSALSLLTTSLGNYLSSFILTVVTLVTTSGGQLGWIPDNLNQGHLDRFFWLLAGLSFLNMVVYIFCAKLYKSKASS
ncbi:hypothetical protein R6Q57_011365 [Mikania cordata]